MQPLDPASRITLVGAAVDGALGAGKITVGLAANSHALVADGVHSLTDLATDAGVLLVARVSRARPDAEHPYGHGRFETLASLVLGAILLLVAGGLAQDSIQRLLAGTTGTPGAIALLAAAVSIVAKEWVFRATRRVADATRSPLLLANAWHSRSDALSSAAVLVGVGGALLGWHWCDLAAALAVAALIGWVGWGLIASAARELVDTGLPAATLARLTEEARAVHGVLDVHNLRSRRMGSDVLVDVDIEVGGTLSVSEGHRIATAVRSRLIAAFAEIAAVNVHVDPLRAGSGADAAGEANGDGARPAAPDAHLPQKAVAEAALRALLPAAIATRLERLTLHYGSGGVDVELLLRAAAATETTEVDPDALLASLRAEGLDWLATLRIWAPVGARATQVASAPRRRDEPPEV